VAEAAQADNYFVWFDGIDDSMVTPSITPGIDKVQAFAGVRKLSDAATGAIAETSTDFRVNNGAFILSAPSGNATDTYGFGVKGSSSFVESVRATTYSAPISNVVTGLADIGAPLRTIRANGSATTSDTALGATNFGNYPMYIGSRAGTSVRFNGQLFQLITRFGANLDANVITQTETYVAGKTAGVELT
jgi:hypothetical protein